MSGNDKPRPNFKRKRYEPEQKDLQTRLIGKLHHVSKEVRQAAKKAKAFETQRLVKKLKTARKESSKASEIKDLESQLETLKHFSHDQIACTALQTKIHKDKVLPTHIRDQDIAALFPSHSETPLDGKQLESRLLSSKLLAEEINRAISGLRTSITPTGAASMEDSEQIEALRPSKRTKQREKQPEVKKPSVTARADQDSEDSRDENSDEGTNPSLDKDADVDGWESGTVNDSEFEGEKDVLSSLPEARLKPKTTSATSTFLPSLAVGYVRGSDESDFSDSEAKVVDGGRKNRRGQRARRAIWEKKFGHNAKHIRKEVEAKKTRARLPPNLKNRLLPSKPFAIQEPRGRPKDPEHPKSMQNQESRKITGESKLHPSWEAKRKEKEKQVVGIVPFQGKKITF